MFGVHYNLSSLPFRSSDQTTYPLVKCFVNENVILVLEHENYISQGVSQHSSQVETKIDIIDNVLLPGIGQMFLLTLFNLGSLLVPPCCQMIFDIFLNNNCFKSFETSSNPQLGYYKGWGAISPCLKKLVRYGRIIRLGDRQLG